MSEVITLSAKDNYLSVVLGDGTLNLATHKNRFAFYLTDTTTGSTVADVALDASTGSSTGSPFHEPNDDEWGVFWFLLMRGEWPSDVSLSDFNAVKVRYFPSSDHSDPAAATSTETILFTDIMGAYVQRYPHNDASVEELEDFGLGFLQLRDYHIPFHKNTVLVFTNVDRTLYHEIRADWTVTTPSQAQPLGQWIWNYSTATRIDWGVLMQKTQWPSEETLAKMSDVFLVVSSGPAPFSLHGTNNQSLITKIASIPLADCQPLDYVYTERENYADIRTTDPNIVRVDQTFFTSPTDPGPVGFKVLSWGGSTLSANADIVFETAVSFEVGDELAFFGDSSLGNSDLPEGFNDGLVTAAKVTAKSSDNTVITVTVDKFAGLPEALTFTDETTAPKDLYFFSRNNIPWGTWEVYEGSRMGLPVEDNGTSDAPLVNVRFIFGSPYVYFNVDDVTAADFLTTNCTVSSFKVAEGQDNVIWTNKAPAGVEVSSPYIEFKLTPTTPGPIEVALPDGILKYGINTNPEAARPHHYETGLLLKHATTNPRKLDFDYEYQGPSVTFSSDTFDESGSLTSRRDHVLRLNFDSPILDTIDEDNRHFWVRNGVITQVELIDNQTVDVSLTLSDLGKGFLALPRYEGSPVFEWSHRIRRPEQELTERIGSRFLKQQQYEITSGVSDPIIGDFEAATLEFTLYRPIQTGAPLMIYTTIDDRREILEGTARWHLIRTIDATERGVTAAKTFQVLLKHHASGIKAEMSPYDGGYTRYNYDARFDLRAMMATR